MSKPLDASGYDTDKSSRYLNNYQEHFRHLAGQEVFLLELGVHKGGSLLLWRDYFEKGRIVGLDVKEVPIEDATGRIRVYQGLQQDCALLDRIGGESAPRGFDVIIDDASHVGEWTRVSFWHLFERHLKPGGIYVIEDWRTGYWDAWEDGRRYRSPRQSPGLFGSLADALRRRRFPSHDHGMVGVIKQLVDELGMDMITNPERGGSGPQRDPGFRKMEITPGQVFIWKTQGLPGGQEAGQGRGAGDAARGS